MLFNGNILNNWLKIIMKDRINRMYASNLIVRDINKIWTLICRLEKGSDEEMTFSICIT